MKNLLWVTAILKIFLLGFTPPSQAQSAHALGGLHTTLQIEIVPLQKDAKLIGLSAEALEKAVVRQFTLKKITISQERSRPAFVLKVTTLDVGPQVVSYVLASLQEPGRIARHKSPLFVTSWSAGKLLASEPTKHEHMVLKATQDLIEDFLRASLE